MKRTALERYPKKKIRPIEFRLDNEQRRAVDVLCDFFKLNTRAKLFKQMLILAVADVASLSPKNTWTEKQRTAYQHCRNALQQLQQGLVIGAAKEIIRETKPALETLQQLSKQQLTTLAESKHISTTGLRRTGLIRKILND